MKNPLSEITVLYVDNNTAMRSCFERLLKRKVGSFYLAENGKDGLEIYKRNKPDVIITDIHMPLMNGLCMAQEIKKLDQSVPIIITTTCNDEDFVLQSIDIGVDGYLKVPINYKQLLELLTDFSERLSLKRQLSVSRQVCPLSPKSIHGGYVQTSRISYGV